MKNYINTGMNERVPRCEYVCVCVCVCVRVRQPRMRQRPTHSPVSHSPSHHTLPPVTSSMLVRVLVRGVRHGPAVLQGGVSAPGGGGAVRGTHTILSHTLSLGNTLSPVSRPLRLLATTALSLLSTYR